MASFSPSGAGVDTAAENGASADTVLGLGRADRATRRSEQDQQGHYTDQAPDKGDGLCEGVPA